MLRFRKRAPLEMWGGVECTVNRVGDEYFDQMQRGGHADRLEDLDLIAGLGIRKLRYPVLWERTAPGRIEDADWTWPDARLARLRELGVEPIVGLVHHGSGPAHTSLVDDSFAEGLEAYAGAVARRYPWVEHWTPVNEPLTTARFSALYGHWYPHAKDDYSFVRAVLVQCRATVLAMRAIRRVNPSARLVQTEDYARTAATPRLAYQAAFENERRWLSLDLLCGRVDRRHPLWGWLAYVGIAPDELRWFEEHPTPPDIIGINYYATSERYLDDDLASYTAALHGGNGRDAYADVEVVRVQGGELAGHAGALLEAWRRYRRTLAITEAHLGCTREEQMRWLLDAWDGAAAARDRGADVRAVTAWALFGSLDWHCLVTRADGHYEPGVFDARQSPPRATALAGLVRALSRGERPSHAVLGQPGWWRRPDRVVHARAPRRDIEEAAG